jgi:hypothetical protein
MSKGNSTNNNVKNDTNKFINGSVTSVANIIVFYPLDILRVILFLKKIIWVHMHRYSMNYVLLW